MNTFLFLATFATVFSVDNSRPLADSFKEIRAKRASSAECAIVKLAPGLYELGDRLELGKADSNLELVGALGTVLTRSIAAVPGGIVECAETPTNQMKFAQVKRILPLFFYDGKWARPARWPNEGFATFSESVDTGVRGEYRSGTAATGEKLPGSFRFKEPRAEKWDFSDGIRIEGYFFYDWAYESLVARGYDKEKGVLSFAVPSTFGIGGPKQSSFFTERRFIVSNVRAELDAPGEYFYDRKTKKVEFIAPEGGVREFRTVNRPGGIFRLHDATNVTIRGIAFRYAADEGVEICRCQDVLIEDCRVSEVGGDGIWIGGGRRCVVRNCEIAFVGRGGVSMHGGNRQSLTRGDNMIENCRIHDSTLVAHVYAAGVSVSGCGNVVRGNEIFNAPHSGVIYGGNEQLFESNHVHHVLKESCDAGVFYTGQDATDRGNVLRWNLVEDSGIILPDGRATGTIAFYLDDCVAGSTVVSNVVRRVPKGVAIGGGHENLVLYNTFEDCPSGVSPDARALSVHKERWDRDWHQTEKLRQMNINKEPWKSRYPLLSQYTPENYPRTPEHCRIVGNTFLRVKNWFGIWDKACRREMFEIRDNRFFGFDFTRRRLFPGFEGRFCKIQPTVATDWKGTALLTFQRLLLSGSDVFYGEFISKSADGGATWSEPEEIALLRDERRDGARIARYANVRYARRSSRWYALGMSETYLNDDRPFEGLLNGRPTGEPLFVTVDAAKAAFTAVKTIPFPFAYQKAMPFGDPVELDDGELVIPFYFIPADAVVRRGAFTAPGKVVCLRYRFAADGLELVRAGEPIECPELKRGVSEPSLVRFGGRFYLTLRSDERGMFAESGDGLVFGPLKTWRWEDGEPIGNRNTQQHWLELGDRLYLAYTRENGTNGHVFRNRAPVYAAYFDTAKGALVRSSETTLVPELGARLGNFQTVSSGMGESWLVTAEWMQPVGCERYGSDNSLWLVKLRR